MGFTLPTGVRGRNLQAVLCGKQIYAVEADSGQSRRTENPQLLLPDI